MNHVEIVWRQLNQRRLLPVAILLVVALVAIPFLLAADPEPASVAPAPAGDEAVTAAALPESVVALAEAGDPASRRRVLGARKNPFRPAPLPPERPQEEPSTTRTAPSGGSEPTTSAGGAPTGGASPGPIIIPIPTPTPDAGEQPKPEYELYSLTVRFGDSTADQLQRMNLARLKPLPDADAPVLVYLGVSDDRKRAVFVVDEGVEIQGDGSCKPSPENCETLHLAEGETVFLDVVDESGATGAQYQLDLLDIRRRTTGSAAKARTARAAASRRGAKALKARVAASGPLRYRYDRRTGTVERLDAKTFKAATARATTAFAGAFSAWR